MKAAVPKTNRRPCLSKRDTTGSEWVPLAAADPDPVPLKRSPNGSIYLPQVNEHRRLRRSLNVSVTFVSALMNNGERGVMEVYLASGTCFRISMKET